MPGPCSTRSASPASDCSPSTPWVSGCWTTRRSVSYTHLFQRDKPQPFSEADIELAQSFADQAVIAIENVRLFNETQEALARQTATSDVLQVISESPTDVQPVFDIIAERAAALTQSRFGLVIRVEGDALNLASMHGSDPAAVALARQAWPCLLYTSRCV